MEGRRLETWCQQALFIVESTLKSNLPLVICTHNINSSARLCIGCQFTCFTCERCNMSSLNKKSTGVVATFKQKVGTSSVMISTWRLVLLKLERNHFVCPVIPSCCRMSARTRGVAVAVSAMNGTPEILLCFKRVAAYWSNQLRL